MRHRILRALLIISLISLTQFFPDRAFSAPTTQDAPDIVETAIAAGSFDTLVAAVQAAGLAETLQGEGPFTVFAPTDEAFAALPEGTVEALLEDPEGALKDILLYHVVPDAVKAAAVANAIGQSLEMANGQITTITVDGSRLLLNDAGFIAMNIEATNGIIHVIDKVILPVATPAEMMTDDETSADAPDSEPPADATVAAESANDEASSAEEPVTEESVTEESVTEEPAAEEPAAEESVTEEPVTEESAAEEPVTEEPAAEEPVTEEPVTEVSSDEAAGDTAPDDGLLDIVDLASGNEDFSTLVAAVQAAGLVDALKDEGPFTVFAPTDAAFAALPEGTVETLLADPSGALTDILLYHVISGTYMAADVTSLNGVAVPTLNGATIVVSVEGDQVLLNDVAIIATDLEASNGVIHVIDAVLLPPAEVSEPTASAAGPDEAGASEAPEGESTADAAEASSGCSAEYHVQRGDTLSEIAAVYGVDMRELAQANGIRNANYVYRGQRLCIP